MPEFQSLLDRNRAWVKDKVGEDPEFFARLTEGQRPPFLFFGCSDSRKSLNSKIGAEPGELFVHRNIANQVPPGDANVQAVLEYAILHLQVRHVVVGGHTHCGGVGAALAGLADGAVGAWLSGLRDLATSYSSELASLPSPLDRANRLAEINVVVQVRNVVLSGPFQEAQREGRAPSLHGWIFDLGSGLIQELELPLEEWKEEGLLS